MWEHAPSVKHNANACMQPSSLSTRQVFSLIENENDSGIFMLYDRNV
jgi:hypothetical protein